MQSGMAAKQTLVETPVADPTTSTGEGERTQGPTGPRIRCPRCNWSPKPKDTWTCVCGHEWNTFDTGGVCPHCIHQWSHTQCLSCHGWSPHSDWYEY